MSQNSSPKKRSNQIVLAYKSKSQEEAILAKQPTIKQMFIWLKEQQNQLTSQRDQICKLKNYYYKQKLKYEAQGQSEQALEAKRMEDYYQKQYGENCRKLLKNIHGNGRLMEKQHKQFMESLENIDAEQDEI